MEMGQQSAADTAKTPNQAEATRSGGHQPECQRRSAGNTPTSHGANQKMRQCAPQLARNAGRVADAVSARPRIA